MEIEKIESDEELRKIAEAEFERYGDQYQVAYNAAPFSFAAKENGSITGIITGSTCYAEVHISELIVLSDHRGKHIGTQLLKTVEEYYHNSGFDHINLSTRAFQAPGFYEKCGFELEFIRKNKHDPKLNRYFYVKYF